MEGTLKKTRIDPNSLLVTRQDEELLKTLEYDPNITIHRDVLSIILVKLDAGKVLDLAKEACIVQRIIKEPNFWKRKMEHDLPELFVKYVNQDVADNRIIYIQYENSIYSVFMEELNGEEKVKYRNIYFVLRYIVWQVRKIFMRYNGAIFSVDGKYYFRPQHCNSSNCWLKISMTDRREENSKYVDWLEMISDGKFSPVFYLWDFMKKVGRSSSDTRFERASAYALAVMTVAISKITGEKPYTDWQISRMSVFNISNGHSTNFVDMINQGYVSRNGAGKMIIGHCATCKWKPSVAIGSCCKQVSYCSEECAEKDWPKHYHKCKK